MNDTLDKKNSKYTHSRRRTIARTHRYAIGTLRRESPRLLSGDFLFPRQLSEGALTATPRSYTPIAIGGFSRSPKIYWGALAGGGGGNIHYTSNKKKFGTAWRAFCMCAGVLGHKRCVELHGERAQSSQNGVQQVGPKPSDKMKKRARSEVRCRDGGT